MEWVVNAAPRPIYPPERGVGWAQKLTGWQWTSSVCTRAIRGRGKLYKKFKIILFGIMKEFYVIVFTR